MPFKGAPPPGGKKSGPSFLHLPGKKQINEQKKKEKTRKPTSESREGFASVQGGGGKGYCDS